MPTISRNPDSSASWLEGAADSYYELTAGVERPSANKADLRAKEGAQITVEIDLADTSNDLIVYFYASDDGTDFDTEPFASYTFDKDGDDTQQESFIVHDFLYVGLGFYSDSPHEVRASYISWNYTT